MKNNHENDVYIVSLSREQIKNSELRWIDIVNLKKKYFYPLNGCWPRKLKYIGFRCDSELKAIYKVEEPQESENLHEIIEEMPDEKEDFVNLVYDLQEEILLGKTIKYGDGIHQGLRMYCNLDILLRSDTIREAYERTKELK